MRVAPDRQPRVTVVIPAFNASRDIASALDSVFGQDFSDFEVIVVNDGSPDTAALEDTLAPFRDRITYCVQPNRGAAAARNHGIRLAAGEYVAFLDADDVWYPTFLSRQVSFLDAYPTCGVVYTDARMAGQTPLAGRRFMEQAPSTGAVTLVSLIRQTCNIPLSTVMARRPALEAVGLFDEALRRGQDFDLWLKVAARGTGIAFQRQVLAERRVRSEGLSGDRLSELRRALNVLSRFTRKVELPHDAWTAARLRIAELVRSIELEQAKARLREADFAGARRHLSAAGCQTWKWRVAGLVMRVAPRVIHHAVQRLRPSTPAPAFEAR